MIKFTPGRNATEDYIGSLSTSVWIQSPDFMNHNVKLSLASRTVDPVQVSSSEKIKYKCNK